MLSASEPRLRLAAALAAVVGELCAGAAAPTALEVAESFAFCAAMPVVIPLLVVSPWSFSGSNTATSSCIPAFFRWSPAGDVLRRWYSE